MNNSRKWKEEEHEVLRMPFLKSISNTSDGSSLEYEPRRIILFLDVDCFEVQLWMNKLRPDLIKKDVPVVVINPDRIILSVNYTAKSLGVKRGEGRRALTEARALCEQAGTELVEITAGECYGKVDSFLPVIESDRILDVIHKWVGDLKEVNPYLPIPIPIQIERTCRDEFCLDVTGLVDAKIKYYTKESQKRNFICIPNKGHVKSLCWPKDQPNDEYDGQPRTIMEGRNRQISGDQFRYRVQQIYPLNAELYHEDELRLVHGASIASTVIALIECGTKYQVSAGVGHSKLISKLACGLNKPNGIGIITDSALPRLRKKMLLQDLPGFGGKIGDAVRNMLSSKSGVNVKYISDILRLTNNGFDLDWVFEELDFPDYEKKARDLYNKCQFKDESRVTSKIHPDIISTLLSFKDCQRKDEFEEGLWNISKDMKRRINYYKDIGRIAQELVIKADYISPRRREYCNVISLPVKKNDFVRYNFIYDSIIEYIEQNGLRWDKILKIHLTAKNIIVQK